MPLDAPVEKSFEDTLFGAWLEAPVVYGAFDGARLCGFAEGSMDAWNNRFRISNICIVAEEARRQGLGARLMACMLREAQDRGARMVVLETQTCNENAIAFYRAQGFEVIGFDLYAYSNADPARHEVRLEMGKKLTER